MNDSKIIGIDLSTEPEATIKKKIASIIDHTILRPDATEKDIIKLCEEGDTYGFASVVTQPCWIKLCRQSVKNPQVKICGISGFPLGGHTTKIKVAEAASGVEDGADEMDMVMNIGWAKNGEWGKVIGEISEVAKVCKPSLVKVIIECCLLTDEEKVKACLSAVEAGADFVKSSTGFSKWGAKVSDIALMRRVVGPDFGVKASGGIRTLKQAIEMVKAGANRIGTSAGVEIIKV